LPCKLCGRQANRTTQQHEKVKIESIETSATAGAMTGNATSKKQPTFEQFSLVDMSLSVGRTIPPAISAAATTPDRELEQSACERHRLFRIVRV
jgi:hypothetical protein